jgi:hypothetical protein
MSLDLSRAGGYWQLGRGAVHHALVSPDPQVRAAYVRQLAAAASRIAAAETWTNSPDLLGAPGIARHHADPAALVAQALQRARARSGNAPAGPGAGPAICVLILDLPDGLAGQRARVHEVLMFGRYLGISVNLVLPTLARDYLGRAAWDLLAG